MAGVFVCKRTTLDHARTVADTYNYHGYDNTELVINRGLFQVVVRGHFVRRMTPTGACNSHGGGVPPLARLCPTLYHTIQEEWQERKNNNGNSSPHNGGH